MENTHSIARLHLQDAGRISYQDAYALQKEKVQSVIDGGPETLILCEHPPVITMGRMSHDENLLWSRDALAAKGVALERIDRGGDVTLHAPGQLVLYPIMNLNARGRSLKEYLVNLENVVIDLLKDFGILAIGQTGQRGVWVGPDKIASIGIGVRKWVTYHGVAVNVNTDLELFRLIRPCGLDVRMTSMAALSGQPVSMTDVKNKAVAAFLNIFGVTISGAAS